MSNKINVDVVAVVKYYIGNIILSKYPACQKVAVIVYKGMNSYRKNQFISEREANNK